MILHCTCIIPHSFHKIPRQKRSRLKCSLPLEISGAVFNPKLWKLPANDYKALHKPHSPPYLTSSQAILPFALQTPGPQVFASPKRPHSLLFGKPHQHRDLPTSIYIRSSISFCLSHNMYYNLRIPCLSSIFLL